MRGLLAIHQPVDYWLKSGMGNVIGGKRSGAIVDSASGASGRHLPEVRNLKCCRPDGGCRVPVWIRLVVGAFRCNRVQTVAVVNGSA
jgi:hypothetical protein